jgi:flagellar hook assembly protein FlgD
VRVTILDLLGREIVTLTNAEYPAGYQRLRWNGTDSNGNKVGNGIYFYRISATGESGKQFTKVMKMALTK